MFNHSSSTESTMTSDKIGFPSPYVFWTAAMIRAKGNPFLAAFYSFLLFNLFFFIGLIATALLSVLTDDVALIFLPVSMYASTWLWYRSSVPAARKLIVEKQKAEESLVKMFEANRWNQVAQQSPHNQQTPSVSGSSPYTEEHQTRMREVSDIQDDPNFKQSF